LNRPKRIALIIFCIILIPIAGCSRKGPVSVRFTRQVDEPELLSLPKQNGSIVLVVGGEFWTDRNKVGRIPIARREKTFIIGPGAAEMAEKMLRQMFSRVERVRRIDQVEDVEQFDFVIQLIHHGFDDRTLFLPFFSNQRYRVDLGAEVTRPNGSIVGEVTARGSESFWVMNLAAANPYENDERLLDRAGTVLNAAVQESLFELMDELEPLFDSGR
jgi:hypothetical protein